MFDKIRAYFRDTPANYEKANYLGQISEIPPGAIICVRSKSLIGYIIRKVTSAWTNHIAIYFGSGRQAVVEALPGGMVETRLKDSMNDKTQFKVFANKKMSVIQLQIMKSYVYGTLGKKYGWTEILRFLGPKWAKVFHSDRSTNFCSENAVEAFHSVSIKISEKPANESSPGDVEDYLDSLQGEAEGWELIGSWNCSPQASKRLY